MSHHQNCPCTTCSDGEAKAEKFLEYMKSLDWEIDQEMGCVDTDTFEGVCVASNTLEEYSAYCTINRGSGDVTGTIVEIDYSTAKPSSEW